MIASTSLPSLTESAIRARASQRSFARGVEYFEDGSVFEVVWRDGQLTAEVQGSQYDPYLVQVGFAGDEIVYAHCTCPYDWGGDCKHIVAALLFLLHKPQQVECRPSLAELLAPLDREQLVMLLRELAEDVPGVLGPLERRVARMGLQDMAPSTTSSPSQPAVDFNLLRRQIKAELRASIRTGYDAWGEENFYDSDLGAALELALEQAQGLLDSGNPRGALALLEAAARAWDEGIASLDEYVIEAFEDVAEEFTQPLAELWTEVLLSVEFTAEEREDWIAKLEEYTESLYGGGSLEMALTAVQQGWDYPPLVAAMQGNITPKGAWEDEAPPFADFLAEIRLRILERRGQYQEYLNLAQAEGQFMEYLHMLVRMGQADKALAEAMGALLYPEDALALARTMMERGFTDQAFSLAQHGLELEHDRGKAFLAEWLRDQAQANGHADMALTAAQRALKEQISLDNYQALQKIAGPKWEQLRPAALEVVARGAPVEGRVEVYLYEKMYSQAIKTVDNESWYYNIEAVIEAVKEAYPKWAFEQCSKRANEIMDASRSRDYALAVDWLQRGRDILLDAGMQDYWEEHLSNLLEIHQRKYKLVPMLKELRRSWG